jgi:peroxiredoxin
VIKAVTDIQEGIAILNLYINDHPDTVKIINGKFEFEGTIEEPTITMIQVPPSGPARIILESGEISVLHSKKDGYRIGGTVNNVRLQDMDDQLKPYYDKVAELWPKYNMATGEERNRLWNECELAKQKQAEKTTALIKANANYAGLVYALPVYRYETADNIKYYLEELKMFAKDPNYQRMAEFYKGAAQTNTGVKAPDFTRSDPDGKMIALSSFRGKYTLVDFWYSGCHWCRKMTPNLIKIYAELKRKGLEIVSVSVDPKKDEEKWRKAMQEDKATWTQLWDYEKTLPAQYGVMGYPTMFLLDKQGKVVEKIIGYRDEPVLRELFARYNIR